MTDELVTSAGLNDEPMEEERKTNPGNAAPGEMSDPEKFAAIVRQMLDPIHGLLTKALDKMMWLDSEVGKINRANEQRDARVTTLEGDFRTLSDRMDAFDRLVALRRFDLG